MPPFFPEALDKWLLLREEQNEQRTDVEFPFLADGQPYIPAARPVLAGGKTADIHVVGVNLGDGAVKAEGQLLDSTGATVDGLDVSVEGSGAASGVSRLTGTVKAPKGAAPGDYTLVLSVTGSAGKSTSSIPVRIG